jgi:hypothetical protein
MVKRRKQTGEYKLLNTHLTIRFIDAEVGNRKCYSIF